MSIENDRLFDAVFGHQEEELKEPDYLDIANSTRYLTTIEEIFIFSLLKDNERF